MGDSKSENFSLMRHKSFLFFSILIIIFFILLFCKPWFHSNEGKEWLFKYLGEGSPFLELLKNGYYVLLEALVPILIFNFLYEYVTRTTLSKYISEKISDAIVLRGDLMKNYNKDEKVNFLERTLLSIFGDKNGNIVYAAHIKPYINREYNFRSKFKYTIECSEKHSSNCKVGNLFNSIHFLSNDYFFVKQDLSYTKAFYGQQTFSLNTISIGFTFEENTVDEMFNNRSFYFREVIQLTDTDREKFKKLGQEWIFNFAKNFMDITLEIDDKELELSKVGYIEFETGSGKKQRSGFYLEFITGKTIEKKEGEDFSFRLTFTLPHYNKRRSFRAIVSDTTFEPYITFKYLPGIMAVSDIPFFDEKNCYHYDRDGNRISARRVLHGDTVEYGLNGWVTPRSGVVFHWDNK